MTDATADTVAGLRAVAEALAAGAQVNRLFVAKGRRDPALDALLDTAREHGVPFEWVPPAKLNALAGASDHQGVVARVSPVAYHPLEAWLADFHGDGCLLVLDQVQHPKNLGMIIRTAVGAGCAGVIVPARGGALVDDAVVRASAGTVFHVPLVRCGNVAQALRSLQAAGFWVYGMAGTAPRSVFQVDWPARAALVMGNETHGLRHGVAKACDDTLRIPLAPRVESLNVAVAAGIALFEYARQHAPFLQP